MKHKHYDCIVAWANGADIEYRIDDDDWFFHQIVSLDAVQADTKMTFSKGDFETKKENAYKALALVDTSHADKIYKSVADLFKD